MGIYPRPKDKIQRQLERNEQLEFARQGGTPKGAPTCYGAWSTRETKRQIRACNSCSDLLRSMCQAYESYLTELRKSLKTEYECTKNLVNMEYEARAQGKITTPALERARRRKK